MFGTIDNIINRNVSDAACSRTASLAAELEITLGNKIVLE